MSEECCRSWHSHGRCEHMKEPCKLSVPKTLLVFCVSGCNSKRSRELESGQCDPVSSWRIQLNIEVKMKRDGEVNPYLSALTASQVLHLWVRRGRETDRCIIDKHLNSVTLKIEKFIFHERKCAVDLDGEEVNMFTSWRHTGICVWEREKDIFFF